MLKIGAAWCKVSENGKGYLSFNFEPEFREMTFCLKDLNFVGFELDEKKSEKSPDYTIYLDKVSDENK